MDPNRMRRLLFRAEDDKKRLAREAVEEQDPVPLIGAIRDGIMTAEEAIELVEEVNELEDDSPGATGAEDKDSPGELKAEQKGERTDPRTLADAVAGKSRPDYGSDSDASTAGEAAAKRGSPLGRRGG